MSPAARKSTLPSGARSPCLAVLSFTLALTVLLCAAAAPRVHAQTDNDHEETDLWAEDGTVLVSLDAMKPETRPTLEITEGESGTYWVSLSESLPDAVKPDNPWWVFVHVDGQRRADGKYESIRWIPSIGRTFDTGNWDEWKSFQIDTAGGHEG